MAIRTRSVVLLLLAIASGGLAAWLALGYLRQQAQPLLNVTPSATRAVVATKDIQVGSLITENDVRVIDWPGDALPAGLISAPENVVGRAVMLPVRLNQPFLETNLAPRGVPGQTVSGGMAVLVEDGMRGLTIPVDQVVAVAGFVLPGTRVDLLFTGQGPGNEPMTKAIMQNLKVLAAGQSLAVDPAGQAVQVPIITFQLTPEQAETLALASGQGRIQMTLRNVIDTLPIRTRGAIKSALLAGPRPQVVAGGPPRRIGTPQPTAETAIVEVFRGGTRTLDRFTRPRQDSTGQPQREPPQ